ncbi:hypothetical protein JCM3765_007754 [Sporobolomyces pararoseus]
MITLREWLAQNQVYLDPRLAIDQSRPSSTRIVVGASSSLPPNETVARIPKSCILSRRTSSLSKFTQQVPGQLLLQLESLTPPLQLSVHVLYEIAIASRSKWYGYFANCPKEIVDIALLWELEGEAQKWIGGTELELELRRIRIDRTALRQIFNSLVLPLFASLPSTPLSSLRLALDLLLYSYSLVSSRSFQIDNNYHQLALVPLADAFNHLGPGENQVEFVVDGDGGGWVCEACGSARECRHDREDDGDSKPFDESFEARIIALSLRRSEGGTDREDESYEMVTTEASGPLKIGEEVFNSYGNLSNARLIAEYGFKLEANEADRITFSRDELEAVMRETGLFQGGYSADCARKEEQEEVEEDHPLIMARSLLPDEPRFEFFFDADAKISNSLWRTLVYAAILESSNLSKCLEQIFARDQDDNYETPVDGIDPSNCPSLLRIAHTIDRLCERRVRNQFRPQLTSSQLLDLAEAELDERLRLAIAFLAEERLLLERVKEKWRIVQRATGHLVH